MKNKRANCITGLIGALAAVVSVCGVAAPLVGGKTITDARLQQDIVAHPGFVVVVERNGGCKQIDGITSTVVQPPADLAANKDGKLLHGEWQEMWIVSACGKQVPVHLYFKSDGLGGTDFGIGSN
jgi:hypothetical protein